jgi:hypothetical protein
MRTPAIVFLGVLAVGGAGAIGAVLVTRGIGGGTAASRAQGELRPAYSVRMEERRAHADTCQGYNLELEEAAAIQRRINRIDEAERLLGMRQNCSANTPAVIRSAR